MVGPPMSESSAIFLLPREVEEITRLSDLTRSRLEKRGKFPPRIKIGNRKIAWRKVDIEEWSRDPEAWAQRHAGGGA